MENPACCLLSVLVVVTKENQVLQSKVVEPQGRGMPKKNCTALYWGVSMTAATAAQKRYGLYQCSVEHYEFYILFCSQSPRQIQFFPKTSHAPQISISSH